MKIKFWGVRGSITNPLCPEEYRKKIIKILKRSRGNDLDTDQAVNGFIDELSPELGTTFGGNTSCVTVSHEGTLLILDAGTGIKNLATALLSGKFPFPENKEYNILLSHLHLDHINGLPFFTPVHFSDSKLNFFCLHKDYEKFLELQQDYNYFPVSLGSRPSIKKFSLIEEDDVLEFGKMKVRSRVLNHPNRSTAFRIFLDNGRSVVYATDGEYTAKCPVSDYFGFFRGADILIFDAQYSFSELAERYSFGHSTPEVGVDAAVNSEVKELFLFHHNHDNSDEMIVKAYNNAVNYKNEKYPGSELNIRIANEGMEIDLEKI